MSPLLYRGSEQQKRDERRIAAEAALRAASERAMTKVAGPVSSLCCDALVGAPRRPLKRDAWTRGFVCAVAKYIEMYGDGTEATELVRLAGKRDHILKHADEEDIETLRSAGFLCPNIPQSATPGGQSPAQTYNPSPGVAL